MTSHISHKFNDVICENECFGFSHEVRKPAASSPWRHLFINVKLQQAQASLPHIQSEPNFRRNFRFRVQQQWHHTRSWHARQFITDATSKIWHCCCPWHSFDLAERAHDEGSAQSRRPQCEQLHARVQFGHWRRHVFLPFPLYKRIHA